MNSRRCLLIWLLCLLSVQLQGQSADTLSALYFDRLAVQQLHSEPKQALAYARKSLEAAERIRDPAAQAKALLTIGSAYFQLSQYDQALEFYLQSLAINQKTGNWKGESNGYHNIGNVYLYRDQYAKAVEYYEKSRQIDLRHGDKKSAASTLHSIATAYSYFDEDKALETYRQALVGSRNMKDTLSESMTLNNIGLIYFSRKNYGQSLAYFGQCLRLNRLLKDEEGVATNLENIGRAYHGKKQYDKAIDHLLRSSALSPNFKHIQRDNHQYLSEIYQETGDYRQALAHYKQFVAMRDSSFNQESTDKLNELQTRFETSEKEKQIELQQAELSRKNILMYASVAIAALLLGLGIVVYNRYRLKNKANLLLAAANAEIRQSVAEKEVLLQEIHHRVKNNLQLVSSLLTWQSSQITDARLLELIEENKSRIRSMAQIHEYLYRSDNLSHVNAQAYLGGVLDSLGQSYRSEKEIVMEKKIQPLSLLADEAIPLGLIVNELVSNAFKYAFANRPDGKITVTFSESERQYQLCISDNGVGLPDPAQEKKTTSLGLSLVRMLTKQLEGKLDVENRAGTVFRIVFPQP